MGSAICDKSTGITAETDKDRNYHHSRDINKKLLANVVVKSVRIKYSQSVLKNRCNTPELWFIHLFLRPLMIKYSQHWLTERCETAGIHPIFVERVIY